MRGGRRQFGAVGGSFGTQVWRLWRRSSVQQVSGALCGCIYIETERERERERERESEREREGEGLGCMEKSLIEVCVYVGVYVCMYVCMYIYIYLYLCIYLFIHTQRERESRFQKGALGPRFNIKSLKP